MAFEAFKEGFDFVYQEALRGRSGRIDATVHAEYAGRPYIAPGFEKMIRYVESFGDDVRIATCHDMAAYMLKTNLKGEPYRPID